MYGKEAAAVISIGLTTLSYGYYIYSVLRGKIKPHALSWAVWTLLMFIGAAVQLKEQGGLGSYATAFCGFGCLVIFIVALRYGEKKITRGDWASFGIALSIVPIWHLTSSPLLAASLVSAINALAFWPTFSKAYARPFEENPITFGVSSISNAMILVALASYSWASTLYPATMFLLNIGLVLVIFFERKRRICESGWIQS